MSILERFVERIRRAPPIVADGAMAAGIFAVGSVELILYNYPERAGALALLAVAALGLSMRRTKPWLAYSLVPLVTVVGLITHNSYPASRGAQLSELVLLYTLSERFGLAVSVLALAGEFTVRALALHGDLPLLVIVLAQYPFVVMAWFAGRAQARRRAIASDIERSIDELGEERDRLARIAVGAEQGRIARELHTLVLRSVEQMIAKTRYARHLLYLDRAKATESIGAIEVKGRRTLVEVRRLLLVLRTRDAADVSFGVVPDSELREGLAVGNARPSTIPDDELLAVAPRSWAWVKRLMAIPWMRDALVPLALGALALAEPFWQHDYLQTRTDDVLVSLVLVVLLFRRVAPIGVLVVIATIIFVWNLFLTGEPWTADVAIMVAVFSVAALRGLWWGVLAIGAEVIAYAPLIRVPNGCGVPCQVGWTAMFVFAVIAGFAVREGRRLTARLRGQRQLLQRTREQRIGLAVDEERSRVARDVHDMVAHGVTLMVIQAGAARWLTDSDPARAETALRSVEVAGQEALGELLALVGSLGSVSPNGPEPLPGGDQVTIPALVHREAEAGLRIELAIEGDPRPFDAGLELSLYRIVQEALTNVRKHAPQARCRVVLRYPPEGVEVEVTNVGGGTPTGDPSVPGAGQGLLGMAERATLFGGVSEAGPTQDGGFRVRVWLAEERVLV